MKKSRGNLLFQLFLTFAKIGLFTFGGGYTMIGMIGHSCVEQKQWITHDEMMNITVIAESTPGPIAINCATFVGYQQAGLFGRDCGHRGHGEKDAEKSPSPSPSCSAPSR